MNLMIEDLTTWLKANGPITAIVAGRVYGRLLAQNAVLPALVYKEHGKTCPSSMEGVTGLTEEDFSIESYALDFLTAKKLAAVVRQSLLKFSGSMGTTMVLDVILSAERDDYNYDTNHFMTVTDYKIWHREN